MVYIKIEFSQAENVHQRWGIIKLLLSILSFKWPTPFPLKKGEKCVFKHDIKETCQYTMTAPSPFMLLLYPLFSLYYSIMESLSV